MAIRIQASTNQRMVGAGVEKTQVAVNTAAQEAQAKGLGLIASETDQLRLAYMKREKDKDLDNLLEANNAYNREMKELQNRMLEERKLGKAEGASIDFAKEAQELKRKIYNESKIKYRDTESQFFLQSERTSIAMEDAMQKYEHGQVEAYRDIKLNNNIVDIKNLALACDKEEDIDNHISSAVELVKQRLYDRDEEYVKSAVTKVHTDMVKAIVFDKIGKKDFAGSKSILEKYKAKVDQAELLELGKAINEYEEADLRQILFNKAQALYPDDFDKMQAYYKNQLQGGDFWDILSAARNQLGTNYKLGGDGVSATDCGKLIIDAAIAAGYIASDTDREVDVMAKRAREKGVFFTDEEQLQPGDIVYYRNTSDQADIAIDRITHAAIYQGEGKVLHASSSAGKVIEKADMKYIGEIAGFSKVPFERKTVKRSAYEQQSDNIAFQNNLIILQKDIAIKSSIAQENFANGLFDLRKNNSLNEENFIYLKNEVLDSSGLQKEQRKILEQKLWNMYRGSASAPQKSNLGAWNTLNKYSLSRELTETDVIDAYSKGFLSDEDCKKFLHEAALIAQDKDDVTTKRADERWIAKVDAKIFNEEDRRSLINNLSEELRIKEIKGNDRFDYAAKVIDGHLKNYFIDSVGELQKLKYSSTKYFGAQADLVADRVKKGIGEKNNRSQASDFEVYYEMDQISSLLEKGRKSNDPYYKEAYDYLLSKGEKLTAEKIEIERNKRQLLREGNIVSLYNYDNIPKKSYPVDNTYLDYRERGEF